MYALKQNQTLYFPIPHFFNEKNLVQPWSGEHAILEKSISTLKIKMVVLTTPFPPQNTANFYSCNNAISS